MRALNIFSALSLKLKNLKKKGITRDIILNILSQWVFIDRDALLNVELFWQVIIHLYIRDRSLSICVFVLLRSLFFCMFVFACLFFRLWVGIWR